MFASRSFMCRRIAGATCFSRRGSVLSIGILLELVGDVLVDGLGAASERREVVAHDAGFEGSLVAVQRRAPRVGGVGAERRSGGASRRPSTLSNSNMAVWVVGDVVGLPPLRTRSPPNEEILFGQPSSMNQRTMSNMWMPMSPVVPLPYSMKLRQLRWISGRRASSGAGPHPEVPVERLGHGRRLSASMGRPPPYE